MKIVIDISAEDFEKVKCGRGAVSMMRKAIIHGTPLPEGAEILTKEAYSDLCLRAANYEARKAEPCEDDLISRREAIKYFMTNTNWHDEEGYKIDDADEKRKLLEDYFSGVPSVKPSSTESSCSTTDSSTDCISRESALEILDDYAEDIESGNWGTAYSKARTSMCDLPSVEPERKTGHWEWDKRAGEYVCSECGCNPIYEGTTPDVSEIDKYKFCRWCGAKMAVEIVNKHMRME